MDNERLKFKPARRFKRSFLQGNYLGHRVTAHRDPAHCNWFKIYIDGRFTLIRHVSTHRMGTEYLADYLAEAAMAWIDRRMCWDPAFRRREEATVILFTPPHAGKTGDTE